jgi:site-specific DNA-methyltransferase (adenine-specific)
MKDWKNQLYFGDNLDILKDLHHQHPEGFIDLIYIDPPFNSKRNYNVLFESVDMEDATAQKEAFADTWSNVSYMDTLNQIAELDISLFNFLKNLDNTNISKGAISYLTTMAIRLWYMHKLLKKTGSFYLHCDPTMSHYLKILCDLIFGIENFINQISWERIKGAGKRSQYKQRSFGRSSDAILFYSRTSKYYFDIDSVMKPYTDIEKDFSFEDDKGRYKRRSPFRPPGLGARPNLCYEYKGITPPHSSGWTVSKENLIKLDNAGELEFTSANTVWRKQRPANGIAPNDIWVDIGQTEFHERLGYQTQKPEALLDRIILASSSKGDLVADFFCGCGTTVASAQSLGRKWLGVDISHLAVRLIAKRLMDAYGDDVQKTFEVHGFPKDIDSAKELANNVKGGRLQFEDWIIEVLLHGITNERRNEMGFDGYRTFELNGKKHLVMIEVKSGSASASQVNHFIKTVEDKKGSIGVFVCFAEQITHNMQLIAKKEGLFTDDAGNSYSDKIQIISVEDLLQNKRPMIPQSVYETFKKAERKSSEKYTQTSLDLP